MNPITPEEAAAGQLAQVPPEVIDVFNVLIAENFDGRCARIDQNDVIRAILNREIAATASEVFGRRLLDVEHVYAASGWIVWCDKPALGKIGATYFVFEPVR